MKRYLKIILLSALAIIILFCIAYGIGKWYVISHKKEIIANIKAVAERKYHSVISISDLDLTLFSSFPFLSIQLDAVDVQGPMYHIHKQKLFTAEKIDLRLSAGKLLFGKIVIGKTHLKKGSLFLYTDSMGISNLSYFTSQKQKADKQKKPFTIPDNILFEDFTFTLQDLQKEKLYSFTIHTLDASTTNHLIKLKKDITVNSLAFNSPRGSFLKNKRLTGEYTINYNPEKQHLSFEKITMLINEHPFEFTGKFELGKSAHFTLDIQTKKIAYTFAQSLVLPHIAKALSNVSISAPLDVHTTLSGALTGGDPLVIAKWSVTNTTLGSALLTLQQASFSGLYTNEVVAGFPRKDSNSKVDIYNLKGNWEGIPISAKRVSVTNLTKPKVEGNFESKFSLPAFNNLLGSETLSFSDGSGLLRVNYAGPLDSISKKNASIDIALQLTKGKITLHPLNMVITECETDIAIRDADVTIKKLFAKTSDGSKLTISGSSTNTLALLDEDPGKVLTDIHIYSPYLNLTDISKMLRGQKRSVKKIKKNRLERSIARIDRILEKETVQLSVTADKIKQGNLVATNFKTKATLSAGVWNLNELAMQLAGGDIKLSAKIDQATKNTHRLQTGFTIRGVSAPALFWAFNNFGFSEITHKNITGTIHASGQLQTFTDKQGNIDKKQLNGNVRFSLKNGSLQKIGALEEIGNKYLKKRNLSDLRFAEIGNRLTITEGMVNVPRMQIESSAFRLYIEGKYGLLGNTDLRIQLPLSNLSAPDSGYIPTKTKKNKKGGMSIYLRAKSGADGKIGIGLDMLGALRKTNVSKK